MISGKICYNINIKRKKRMCSGMNWCWNNVLHKHLLHLAPVELSVYQQIEEKKKVIYHEMKHKRYIMKRGKIIKKKLDFYSTEKRR